jgi:hypothetical protein
MQEIAILMYHNTMAHKAKTMAQLDRGSCQASNLLATV